MNAQINNKVQQQSTLSKKYKEYQRSSIDYSKMAQKRQVRGNRNTNEGYMNRQGVYRHNNDNTRQSIHTKKEQIISYISQLQQQEESQHQYSFKNRLGSNQLAMNYKKDMNSINGIKSNTKDGIIKDKNKNSKNMKSKQSNKQNKIIKNGDNSKLRSISQLSRVNNRDKKGQHQDSHNNNKLYIVEDRLKRVQQQKRQLEERVEMKERECLQLRRENEQMKQGYEVLLGEHKVLIQRYTMLYEQYQSIITTSKNNANNSNPNNNNPSIHNQHTTSQEQFIFQCTQQIKRLKILVKQLTSQRQILQLKQLPNERQQIKDRIIMKLQDELITYKLLLQEMRMEGRGEREERDGRERGWGNGNIKPVLKDITMSVGNHQSNSYHKQTLSYQQNQQNQTFIRNYYNNNNNRRHLIKSVLQQPITSKQNRTSQQYSFI